MSPHIEDTLRRWITFYHQSRRVGHTLAACNGAKKTEAYLVCHNHSMSRAVGVKTLVYTEDDKLLGFRAPVVWDNCALTEVFIHAARRIDALKNENMRLEAALVEARRPKPTRWQILKAKTRGKTRRALLWFRGGLR